MATTREELAAAAIACEGRVWYTTHDAEAGRPPGRRAQYCRAHDRRQPEKGAADRGQDPRAHALERAQREEATLMSLLDHSFGDG